MHEVILNLLPVTEADREEFLSIAPDAEHLFFPAYMDGSRPRYPTKAASDPELLSRVTVALGFLNGKPEALRHAKNLKWLQAWSAGVDPFLAPGLLPEGAALTSAVGCYGQSVSEHMLAMLLDLCKRIWQYRDGQRKHEWGDYGLVKTIRGATVLVLGTGDLGSSFASLCQALGSHTVGLRRSPGAPVAGFDEIHSVDLLDDWLPRADVVCLMLPHSAQTVHIIDARRLALMKPDAILLNGGRGTAIDLQALQAALHAGHLWGAGLDVVEPEPLPPGDPLWDCDRLLLTPHVAGGLFHLAATSRNIIALAKDNLRRFLAGEPLHNRMN